MSKGTIFYVIGFALIAFPLMIDRYVVDLPSLLSYGPAIAGFICIYIGMKVKGEKINWNFDFSPTGTTAQSRRKEQQKR
jgi:heme/copper-type cytochrome/quinol oxidase subunit 1